MDGRKVGNISTKDKTQVFFKKYLKLQIKSSNAVSRN